MSITLVAGIGAADSILSISAPVNGCVPGNMLRLESELVEVGGHPHSRGSTDTHLVSVKRGRAGTTAAPHAAGTVVMGAADAFVSASDETMPPPIVENGGGGGAHPNLAAHETLGLAAAHDHDYAADDHAHAEYATDSDLTTHAATAHGTQAHAISGASHTGSLDHSALGSVTANQHHNQSHALGGGDHTGSLAQSSVTNLTTDLAGKASTSHDHDGVYATDDHTHPGGSEAFPVGSVFIAVVSTNPGTLLGYGTWSAFAAGRMLVGLDSGQTEFDTVEETGGAKTVTLTTAEMPAHGHTQNSHNHTQDSHNHTQNAHVHDEFNNSATTGGLVGWGAQDTSTNNASLTGYDTGSTTATNIAATATNQAATATNQNTGGDGAHQNLPPYIVVYMWKRTA